MKFKLQLQMSNLLVFSLALIDVVALSSVVCINLETISTRTNCVVMAMLANLATTAIIF